MSRIQHTRRNSSLNGWFSSTRPTSQYPQTYAGLPEDMDKWSCDDFKTYYQRNKAIIGKTAAIELAMIEYPRLSWTSTIYNWCKYDCNFVRYFEAEGIPDSSNIFAQIYCIGNTAVDATGNVIDTVGNVTNTLSTLTSNKVVVLGLLGVGAYYFLNKKK